MASDDVTVWIAHEDGLPLMGPLPPNVTVRVLLAGDSPLPGPVDGVRFWVPPFLSSGAAVAVAEKLPDLQVVQLLSAGADAWVGRLPEGVRLCDARGVHSSSTAEWTAAVILAHYRLRSSLPKTPDDTAVNCEMLNH